VIQSLAGTLLEAVADHNRAPGVEIIVLDPEPLRHQNVLPDQARQSVHEGRSGVVESN
jgi:hypothetical protein